MATTGTGFFGTPLGFVTASFKFIWDNAAYVTVTSALTATATWGGWEYMSAQNYKSLYEGEKNETQKLIKSFNANYTGLNGKYEGLEGKYFNVSADLNNKTLELTNVMNTLKSINGTLETTEVQLKTKTDEVKRLLADIATKDSLVQQQESELELLKSKLSQTQSKSPAATSSQEEEHNKETIGTSDIEKPKTEESVSGDKSKLVGTTDQSKTEESVSGDKSKPVEPVESKDSTEQAAKPLIVEGMTIPEEHKPVFMSMIESLNNNQSIEASRFTAGLNYAGPLGIGTFNETGMLKLANNSLVNCTETDCTPTTILQQISATKSGQGESKEVIGEESASYAIIAFAAVALAALGGIAAYAYSSCQLLNGAWDSVFAVEDAEEATLQDGAELSDDEISNELSANEEGVDEASSSLSETEAEELHQNSINTTAVSAA